MIMQAVSYFSIIVSDLLASLVLYRCVTRIVAKSTIEMWQSIMIGHIALSHIQLVALIVPYFSEQAPTSL